MIFFDIDVTSMRPLGLRPHKKWFREGRDMELSRGASYGRTDTTPP